MLTWYYNYRSSLTLPTRTHPGFTIVELLIVIVIIGILAAISAVTYAGAQDRAKYSSMQSDLQAINKALVLYKVDNGNYPSTIGQTGCTSNWCGWDQVVGDSFIIGLSPKYLKSLPQLPTANVNNDTYLYQSNGTDYQLIRFKPAGLTAAEMSNTALLLTGSGYDGIAWGYKTNANWW
ncbi:Type II secretion system protein G precursor [compost metagenome]